MKVQMFKSDKYAKRFRVSLQPFYEYFRLSKIIYLKVPSEVYKLPLSTRLRTLIP